MFNLSFFSPSWRVSAAAVRWRWRWRQDEREIHIRRWWREKRAVTYHQRVTVRSHSDRPIWYLYFLMFLNNRWNASTSNVMLMYLKCFLDVVISFFFRYLLNSLHFFECCLLLVFSVCAKKNCSWRKKLQINEMSKWWAMTSSGHYGYVEGRGRKAELKRLKGETLVCERKWWRWWSVGKILRKLKH